MKIVLRTLLYLALIVWLGAEIFFPVVAAITFNTLLPDTHTAGTIVGHLLGILHHQRPGFLSFPSSHLVPYLRSRKYPRKMFPEMYSYRELRPRLLAKIMRSYKRFIKPPPSAVVGFMNCAVQQLAFPRRQASRRNPRSG